MVRPLICLLTVPVALAGCIAEVLTTTAIQGELAARDAQASAQALRYAQDSRTKIEAERAIQAYQAENGVYPPSLTALVPNYLASVPLHANGQPYGYDPATGRLLDQAVSAAPLSAITATDRQNLEAIGEAIYRYWESTGRYPQTLDDLDPVYMGQVPTMESGALFEYDPVSGAVYFPENAVSSAPDPAPSARNRAGGGAGAGPLGEVMTGLAIQNDLSNMNTSGASGAGSVARGAVGGVTDNYNARQNRALEQLDP